MELNEVSLHGWRCAELRSGSNTILVSLDFGPRILALIPRGKQNLFFTKAALHGKIADSYSGYGGHRLWTAPEIVERTYEPDNLPVEVVQEDSGYKFTTPNSASGLRKSMFIRPLANSIQISHQVENCGQESHRIAPWAITVMRPGGTCHIPTPEYVSHTLVKLPSIPIVLWPYTSMADERFTWGRNKISLRQTEEEAPQKFGAFVPEGLAAYEIDDTWFVKKFGAEVGTEYPDFGCNFEAYTRNDMLEVESLGPLVTLEPGESVTHDEQWFVIPKALAPQDPVELRAFWHQLRDFCNLA